jgi:hypothetical protein
MGTADVMDPRRMAELLLAQPVSPPDQNNPLPWGMGQALDERGAMMQNPYFGVPSEQGDRIRRDNRDWELNQMLRWQGAKEI